jgi:hypothetical protein
LTSVILVLQAAISRAALPHDPDKSGWARNWNFEASSLQRRVQCPPAILARADEVIE